MTGQEQELPVVRKLLRERTHDFGRGLLGKFLNPDGPEAAELIMAYDEALQEARAFVANIARENGCTFDDHGNFDDPLVQRIDAVLTKARASTGGES
jgi:hypothetical protein